MLKEKETINVKIVLPPSFSATIFAFDIFSLYVAKGEIQFILACAQK